MSIVAVANILIPPEETEWEEHDEFSCGRTLGDIVVTLSVTGGEWTAEVWHGCCISSVTTANPGVSVYVAMSAAVDLLPTEHAPALTPPPAPTERRRVTVDCIENRDGLLDAMLERCTRTGEVFVMVDPHGREVLLVPAIGVDMAGQREQGLQ